MKQTEVLGTTGHSCRQYIWPKYYILAQECNIISYALLESAILPNTHQKSSRSHEAEPSAIWMTEGEKQAGLHFPTGCNEFYHLLFYAKKK